MTIERYWPGGVYVRNLPDGGGKAYAQTVVSTGTRHVHVSGTLPFDADLELVGEGDIAAQTRCVLETIRLSLEAVGAGPEDVVRSKTYVVNLPEYIEKGLPEWNKFFGDRLPSSTTVGVAALSDPRALVEIEAYADLD